VTILWDDGTRSEVLSSTQSTEITALNSASHQFSAVTPTNVIPSFLLQDTVNTITYLNLGTSFPRLSGDVDLKTFVGLVSFDGGNNDIQTITNFVGSSATLEYITLLGDNTVSFNLSSLTNNTLLKGVTVYGNNNIQGNLSSLPSNLTNFDIKGINTTTGNINALPASLLTYINTGNNTTTGDLSGLPPNLVVYYNEGANTVFGNLTSIPATVEYFVSKGNNTIDSYYDSLSSFSPKRWASNMRVIELQPTSILMPESHLATLLIDLTSSGWVQEKIIKCDVNNPTVKRSNFPIAINAIDYLRNIGCAVSVLTAES
jgi:hypothetical protein